MNCTMFQHNILQLFLALILFANSIHSLKILGLFPYPGKSHYFMYKPFLYELANRGHHVTIASHFPDHETNNLTNIDLSKGAQIFQDYFPIERPFQMIPYGFLARTGIENCELLLNSKEIHELIEEKTKFDVTVTEQFNSDCTLGIAYKINAPVVGIHSGTLLPHVTKRFGIPQNPSYVPNQFSDGGTKPSFIQRVKRFLTNTYMDLVFYLNQQKEQNLLAQYYPDIPPLAFLEKQIKFLLINRYFTLSGPVVEPSNVIEVAGLHVDKPKALPWDIASFINEADHGVIFVSFGSMLRASTLPKDKLKILLSVFEELPQRIIWKWEEQELPGKPKNVLIKKWLPQNDILAHPNVKAFLSHGGMLGTIEAVTYGVPVVNIPIFGDQPANAAFLEECGFGVTVKYNELSKRDLLSAFKKTLSEEFRIKAREVTDMFNDRPKSPMDTAIFWTEFAAKHPNVSFTAPSVTVPFYQYYLLDIYGSFAAALLLLYLGLKRICCSRNVKTNNIQLSKTKVKVK